MKRDHSLFLTKWLHSSKRKPLVVRGARQVGKTWLIRDLAKSEKKLLVELNFEKRPDYQTLFVSNDPTEVIRNISAIKGTKIDPTSSILFLDEIQAAPHLLGKLRWFAEDMPELAVVAAGSLLDFALSDHEFSMPVGRIGYLYLEPLSFEEFLEATNHHELRNYLTNYQWDQTIPPAIHSSLINLIKEFSIIGGMPAAVLSWAQEKNLEIINQIHFDLLATYRDDFAKYSGRLSVNYLEDILNSTSRQLGRKFVYKNANPDISSAPLKQALELLSKARVCHRIFATSANGLPLGAEVEEKFFKVILLDSGICSANLGLSLHQLKSVSEISLINNGSVAEQLTGQLLRTLLPAYISPNLYYWQRQKSGSEAEVDYILQHEHEIIPLEVKAGSTGSLKSLHQFMKEKQKKIGIRINSDFPNITPVNHKALDGSLIQYQLLSLPFYLIGQIHRLIHEFKNKKN